VDHRLIAEMIRPGARVLDLGCGDGSLLAVLMSRCGATGLGVDIDLNELLAAIAKGIDVFQRDIDQGLQMIADQSYDYVVLSETLQVVRKPRLVLKEMLRVAREGIVSFPNFGNWRNRLALALKGRMPKSSVLPYEWYETPNIHLATLRDFVALCREDGIRVAGMVPIAQSAASRLLIRLGLWNLGADRVLVRIARGTDAEGR
jgi:methionine biosynthesis protein MetW